MAGAGGPSPSGALSCTGRTGPAKTRFSQTPQTLQGSLPEATSFSTELQVTFVLQALGEAGLTRVWLQQNLGLTQDLLCPVLCAVCPGQKVFKVGIKFSLLSLAQLFFSKLQEEDSH